MNFLKGKGLKENLEIKFHSTLLCRRNCSPLPSTLDKSFFAKKNSATESHRKLAAEHIFLWYINYPKYKLA